MDNRALRRGNAALACIHAAQAVVILALSTDFSLPVTGAFMEANREADCRSKTCSSTSGSAARRRIPVARGARSRARRAPTDPRTLRTRSRSGRQSVPLARIFPLRLADGRPDRDADRHRRLRRAARPLRGERGDDLPRLADGAAQSAGPCPDAPAPLRPRLRRRRSGLDRDRVADRHLRRARARTPDVRLRDLRFAFRSVQQLRGEPGPSRLLPGSVAA